MKRLPEPGKAAAAIIAAAFVLASRTPFAGAAEVENRILSGYDSFIDRFTILEQDTTEVVHEYYGGIATRLRAWNGRRLTFSNTFRFGNQSLDEDADLGLTVGSRENGLVQARAALHMKFFREGSDYEYGNDYGQGNLDLKAGKKFGRFYLLSRSRAEFVEYDERTLFDYDYRYIDTGITIEGGSYFDKFGRIAVHLGRREAPDTTELGYDRFVAEIEGRITEGSLSADISVWGDRRGYLGQTRSSYWSVYTSAGLRWSGASGDIYALRLDSEVLLYDSQNTTFFDNHFLRAGLRGRFRLSEAAAVFLEPRLAGMMCEKFAEERYLEGSAVFGLDLFEGGGYWLSVSYEPGYRGYTLEDNDIYSDFYYNRLSAMGSVDFAGRYSLNLFVSHDPEKHSRRTDDFSVTLLSLTLSAEF